jgi:hypothetical protein
VYVVGAVVAVQLWHALPHSSTSSNTAVIERAVYDELQTSWPVGDVRCTRVSREAANCIVALPNLGRARVSARIDAASGAVTTVALDSAPPSPAA